MKQTLLAATLLLSVAACGDSSSSAVDTEGAARDAGSVASEDATPAVPPRRDEHAVFDLVDNHLLAHHQRDGHLLIRAGSGGLTKYLRFGMPKLRWKLLKERDGIRVGMPERHAILEFPLTAAQVGADVITMRIHAGGKRRLTVKINGRAPADDRSHIVSLIEGWQVVQIPVAAERLVVGPNLIVLRFRGKAAAIEWVQIGGHNLVDGAAPAYLDLDRHALTLGAGYGLAYYIQVPEAGHLVADVTPTCEVSVRARSHDGGEVSGVLRGPRAGVDLGALAGQVARLELVASGCERTELTGIALTIPGPTPVVAKGPPPTNIIFWIMDTVRADKVRVATPGARAEVPTFEALTKAGASFSQYYVQGNESQTSHASFWTSLYPVNHRVLTAGPKVKYQLSRKFDTMPTILESKGFHNVGMTANGTILKWSGYARGFEKFTNLMRNGTGRRRKGRVPAGFVYGLALESLADSWKEAPFFLFIGTIDNHKPWVAHEPWLSRYDPEPYKGPFKEAATGTNLRIPPHTMQCPWTPPLRDRERIFAIYDSAISYQDQVIDSLREQLDEWGIGEQTMLIITADHGEELWEYPGRCGHGSSARESLVRVPFILYYPPLIPGTGVIGEGVEGVDILPTILDALGEPPLEAAQGESLLPLISGVGRGYIRPSYSSLHEYAHTMRLGVWKAFVSERKGIPSIYNVATDPNERTNLNQTRFLERQLLTDVMSMFVIHRKQWKKRYWGVASNMTTRAARELDGYPAAAQGGADGAGAGDGGVANEPAAGVDAAAAVTAP